MHEAYSKGPLIRSISDGTDAIGLYSVVSDEPLNLCADCVQPKLGMRWPRRSQDRAPKGPASFPWAPSFFANYERFPQTGEAAFAQRAGSPCAADGVRTQFWHREKAGASLEKLSLLTMPGRFNLGTIVRFKVNEKFLQRRYIETTVRPSL